MNRLTLSLCCALFALVPACGGGGGSSDGPATSGFSNLDVLVTDAPSDDLLSFEATIEDLRLVEQGGAETANLLAAPIRVDLLSLQGSFAWLASRDLAPGTYVGLNLHFTHDSLTARRNDGSEVAVSDLDDSLTLTFATPIVITADGYRRVVVDVDLQNSILGSVFTPPIQFQARGSVSDDNGSSSSTIDEIKGTVTSIDAAGRSFVMSGFVDDDAQVQLGDVRVDVTDATLLVQDDGGSFASVSAFFSALTAGSTFLEVHGALAGGVIRATRVEVEDGQGNGGASVAKIVGLVLATGPGSQFSMSISSVPQGSKLVAAAFGGTIPAMIDVSYDSSTVFFLEEHQLTTSASLAVGQKVKAKFAAFANAPYLASRVEIEDEQAENEGRVTNTSGLPASLVARLDGDAPAILGGQVASTSTDVTVTLTGASIFLDTEGRPALAASQILTGLDFEAYGPVSGTPSAPTIAATRFKVRAGELDGASVQSLSPGANPPSFTTSGGEIDDPFGAGVTAGPLTIRIASGCVFEGDATSRSAFFTLFGSPPQGSTLRVKVRGIGSGNANEIDAYEIETEVESD